jgi:hypothetical protein
MRWSILPSRRRPVRMAFFTQHPASRPLIVRLTFCLQKQKVNTNSSGMNLNNRRLAQRGKYMDVFHKNAARQIIGEHTCGGKSKAKASALPTNN